MENEWSSWEYDPPIFKVDPTEEIELHRFGFAPWLQPQRLRYCDVPEWLNVSGLSWRRIPQHA